MKTLLSENEQELKELNKAFKKELEKQLLKPRSFYCSHLVKDFTVGNCKTQCKKCNFISKNLEQ